MESRDSFKAELEGLVAEFEHASEALPPDEYTLRRWTQRAAIRASYSAPTSAGTKKVGV